MILEKETNLYSDNAIARGITDSLLNYDESLNQLAVFNKLTNNGQIQGLFMTNGDLYMNASHITTGTLAAARIGAHSIAVSKLTGVIRNGNWEIDLDEGSMTIGNISASNITSGTLSVDRISPNSVSVDKLTGQITNNSWNINLTTGTLTIGNISANNITSGTLSVDRIGRNTVAIDKLTGQITNNNWTINLTEGTLTIGNISANNINTGTLSASRIGGHSLSANKLTGSINNGNWGIDFDEGVFSIGTISASRITTGTLSVDRIGSNSVGIDKLTGQITNSNWTINLTQGTLTIGTISAEKITTGTLSAARIGGHSLSTSKLTGSIGSGSWGIDFDEGTFTIGNISADNITTGTLSASRIGGHSLSTSKLSGSITNGNWGIDFTNGTFTIGNISANNITSGTMSANRISGGTLTLGDSNNGKGTMTVYDARGNVALTINNNSIKNMSGDEWFAINESIATGGYGSTTHGLLDLSAQTGTDENPYYDVVLEAKRHDLQLKVASGHFVYTWINGYAYPVVGTSGSDNTGRIASLHRVTTSGTTFLGVTTYSGSTMYATLTTSDEKLKTNIKDADDVGLKTINKIKHKSFDFIDGGYHRNCGYIAQQLREVVPYSTIEAPERNEKGELVSTTLQLNDHEILVYATKAIQELSAKVERLESLLAG